MIYDGIKQALRIIFLFKDKLSVFLHAIITVIGVIFSRQAVIGIFRMSYIVIRHSIIFIQSLLLKLTCFFFRPCILWFENEA